MKNLKKNPREEAKKILNKYFITRPEQIDIESIVRSENCLIEEIEMQDDQRGHIIYTNTVGLIKINSKLKDYGQKRFTIAHEFGHFIYDHEEISPGKIKIASNQENGKVEKFCEKFAAELLMPEEMFKQITQGKDFNFELITELSNAFQVSEMAAAFRYANIGQIPAAVVVSKKNFVDSCFVNPILKLWLYKKGKAVNPVSSAFYLMNKKNPSHLETTPQKLINGSIWFTTQESNNQFFIEQSRYYADYDYVITIISKKDISYLTN